MMALSTFHTQHRIWCLLQLMQKKGMGLSDCWCWANNGQSLNLFLMIGWPPTLDSTDNSTFAGAFPFSYHSGVDLGTLFCAMPAHHGCGFERTITSYCEWPAMCPQVTQCKQASNLHMNPQCRSCCWNIGYGVFSTPSLVDIKFVYVAFPRGWKQLYACSAP